MTPARLKVAAIAAGSVVASLAITQFLLPGGEGGSGTPGAILFSGVIAGLLNSLLAVGIILVYRSMRIINFVQAAMGAVGGVFTYNFAVLLKWNFFVAVLIGLIVATATGLIAWFAFIRWFRNAPRLVITVLTIALIPFAGGAVGYASQFRLFRDVADLTQEELSGTAPVRMPFDFKFRVGEFPLEFDFGDVFAIVTSILALAGLGLFLRYSPRGIAIRGAAENLDRTRLLGISAETLSWLVWMGAGFLSGLGVIGLSASGGSWAQGGGATPSLLIIALASAVIARMTSIPGAIFAAIVLSTVRTAVSFSYRDQVALVDVGILGVVLVALLLQRSQRGRSEEVDLSGWKATEEYRPIPREMLAVGGIRVMRWVIIAIAVAAVLAYPWVVSSRAANLGGYYAIIGIVILSLVVLTGWSGQASLGQFGLVAFGAIVGGAFTARLGWTFWLALIAVPLLTAAFSLLLGIPALRIRGLYLAVVTYAFAFASHSVFFNENYFGWILPESVDRPTLLLLDFQDERSMYYLSVLFLVLSVLGVLTLRNSRAGRTIIAVRENEANVQSFGVNATRMRLAAFALSGFLCGLAGVLLAHHQRAVQASSFEPSLSLDVFVVAVVGGVGSISGALLGVIYFAIREAPGGNANISFLVGPVVTLAILIAVPGGLAGLFYNLRDATLRIIAVRRQILVPSLFADMDPEALERKLIPLAEPFTNQGLAALPYDQRYKKRSGLYGEERWLQPLRRRVGRRSDDAAALGAAAGETGGLGGPAGEPAPGFTGQ